MYLNLFNNILCCTACSTCKTKKGYMLMNSGLNGEFGNIKNHSQKELLNILKKASVQREIPLTYKNNYLLTWGAEN